MAKYSYNVSCVLDKDVLYKCKVMSSSDKSAISFGKSAFLLLMNNVPEEYRKSQTEKVKKGIWTAQKEIR